MLIQGNCVKRITAVSTGSLQAPSGKSYLVRRLYVEPQTDNSYLVIKVDRKTVGVYRIYGRAGNQLDKIRHDNVHRNIMEFFEAKGIKCSIPVAEGQSLTFSAAGTSPVVVVVYDMYSSGDVTAVMPNGSDSKEYLFLQYMDTSATINATEDVTLDTSLSPAEFPDFPCGKSVPANHSIEILGLVGAPCGAGTSEANKTYSTYVKLVKDRECLFDEDRNGIPFFFASGVFGAISYHSLFSLIGPCVNLDTSTIGSSLGDPLLFEPPLLFKAGEELIVTVSFIKLATYDLPANSIDLAAIMKVKVA